MPTSRQMFYDSVSVSPLLLADRLLTLAQQAESAGLSHTADRLVVLAHTVLDEPNDFRIN